MTARRLACAGCGTAFDCGAGGSGDGCWCAALSYRLPMPTGSEAATADCLCPTCLQALADAAGALGASGGQACGARAGASPPIAID